MQWRERHYFDAASASVLVTGNGKRTGVHTPPLPLADLRTVLDWVSAHGVNILTIVDDKRDLRYFGRLDLHVVHHEHLRGRLTHKSGWRASELVQGGQLGSGIHVTVLERMS